MWHPHRLEDNNAVAYTSVNLDTSWGFTTFVNFHLPSLRYWFPPRHRTCGSRWRLQPNDFLLPSHMDTMGAPEPHKLTLFMREVLGTIQLPKNLVRELLDCFWGPREEGGRSLQCLGLGDGSTTSLGTLIPGRTQPWGWSALTYQGSTGTKPCIYFICSSPSQSGVILKKG